MFFNIRIKPSREEVKRDISIILILIWILICLLIIILPSWRFIYLRIDSAISSSKEESSSQCGGINGWCSADL